MARPQPVQEPVVKPNAARKKVLQEGRERSTLRFLARLAVTKEARAAKRSALHAALAKLTTLTKTESTRG